MPTIQSGRIVGSIACNYCCEREPKFFWLISDSKFFTRCVLHTCNTYCICLAMLFMRQIRNLSCGIDSNKLYSFDVDPLELRLTSMHIVCCRC